MDKSLPGTTAVREVLESIISKVVATEESVAPRAVALRIEARSGGRIAAAEAGEALPIKITVMGESGPMGTVASDIVLSSTGALTGGNVTVRASDFASGVANAEVKFSEPAQGITLTASGCDLTAVTAKFVVVPGLVPFTGRGPQVENKNIIQGKTKKARAVLLAPPQNPGSEALAQQRAKRPVTALNSAGKNTPDAERLGASRNGDAGTNCLCCTMGAITGQATTALVHGLMREKLAPGVRASLDASWNDKDKELVDAEVNRKLEELISKYGTMQDDAIWWRLESLENFMTVVRHGAPTQDELGDAQLRGSRGLMVSEARRRNAESGSGGIKYKVIQDGLADTDPQKSKTYSLLDGEMQAQMAKYPDGTQFQVFVYGPEMQHWLTAEKYNGKVVMEDYQKSKSATALPKASASGPTGYTGDDVPHHPVEKEQAGVFERGYFLALCPESFDASQAWAGNQDWPQPTV